MWLSWVDNCAVGGHGQDPHNEKEKMKKLFNCNSSGEVTEYIGTKVDVDNNKKTIRQTQPVVIQSFEDKFDMVKDGKVTTPAAPGKVLHKCAPKNKLTTSSTRSI